MNFITDILAGELPGRGGSIQAALNLEIAHEEITRFNIKLEGLNGQLPNLDLVNTAMQLCRNQGIQPTLQKQVRSRHGTYIDEGERGRGGRESGRRGRVGEIRRGVTIRG